jgi:hypothetical protein
MKILIIILLVLSLSPAESVYQRYPELREEESLSVIFETIGKGEEKDKIRFPD